MNTALSFIGGAALSALLLLEPMPPIPAEPAATVKVMTVYTCDNLPPAPSEAWQQPELHELRDTCAATENAAALIAQFEADPTAGVVYEP